MKILVATPLFPPDIVKSAQHVKELARRLAQPHRVTVLLYGHLPEQVEGVELVCVDKRRPVFLRIPHFFFRLWSMARHADVIYLQNGISAELPVLLWSLFSRKPLLFHISDEASLKRAQHNTLFKHIETRLRKRALSTIEETPLPRPNITPFEKEPDTKLRAYEASWAQHLSNLEETLRHV